MDGFSKQVGLSWQTYNETISTQSSSAHDGQGGKSSGGEPGARPSLIGFNKKTINLIGSFKFARERVNLRQVWRMSGFFPGNVEVNNSRFHDSKTTLHDYLGRITKFPNFQIKYISYISKIDQEKESNVKNQIKIQRHLCSPSYNLRSMTHY